jgi:hypothetical protein
MANKIQLRTAKKPVVTAASEYRLGDSAERAVGYNGEINASNKRDLLQRGWQLMQAASSGRVVADAVLAERVDFTKRNKDLLVAAFNDATAHQVLGQKMAESLYVTANRQGFMRKFLAKNEVKQGSIPRFPIRTKNVTAVMSTSATKIDTEITRDRWLTPPEIQIVARPFVPLNEIQQSSGDVLEEKYVEATEAVMVTEDRLMYNLCNQLVGVDNPLSIISGQLTPFALAQVMQQVIQWGLKAPYMLMATDLMQDIIGNSEFYTAIDPVARHELLLTGELGTIYGMALVSDATRHPEHKVLSYGEFFVFADDINFGAYSDRDGIDSMPINITTEQIPGRGWVLTETMAMALANSRASAKGIRS